ncbi:DNA repair protein rad10 [Schizophyllum commune H4-8]|uniref:DNA repair protein rad10 n=1 Tax=Schizophyllum commune (strain H4-8 / FGSC 9210) TaxID=578458 RepID=UPI00215E5157|nr:DNA repair protein rad10 [Schizophyllum commune H4-8]KAI5889429.1 DNA repair protein rad10 [Schizophyllum commune H4-8]
MPPTIDPVLKDKPANPPVVVPSGGGNNIIVRPVQRGNPVLEAIKHVGKEYGDIVADFQVGRTTGVLFLSLKYHRLHPEYVHSRIEKLGHSYTLRILLILCDVSEHRDPIRELTKTCLINNITVIVAFSVDEAGHYLATFKQFENRPPDMIKERVDKDYNSVLRSALTSISKVNKTDVETLRTSFGSFADIARASSDQLSNLPGFGQVKVKNIKNAFEKPIRNKATSALPFVPSQASQQSSMASSSQASTSQRSSTAGAGSSALATPSPAAIAGPSTTLTSSAAYSSSTLGPSHCTPATPSAPRPGARSPSPEWDIEKDLSPEPEASSKPRPPRSPSPVWDIELDLN